MNGRRCGSKHRVVAVKYHGSSDLYSLRDPPCEPGWVAVYLCAKHRTPKPRRAAPRETT